MSQHKTRQTVENEQTPGVLGENYENGLSLKYFDSLTSVGTLQAYFDASLKEGSLELENMDQETFLNLLTDPLWPYTDIGVAIPHNHLNSNNYIKIKFDFPYFDIVAHNVVRLHPEALKWLGERMRLLGFELNISSAYSSSWVYKED